MAVEDSTVVESLMADATYTDKKVGDGHILHHHPVGVGHAESTPPETALPVRPPDVKKRVVERGSPALNEQPKAASRAG